MTARQTETLRRIVDALPEFLTKRGRGFGAERERLAREGGVTPEVMMGIANGLVFAEGDLVQRARYIWRSPYAVKRDALDSGWEAAVAAGVARADPEGWRLDPRGLQMAKAVHRAMREYLARIPAPQPAARRAADSLEPIAARIPAEAERVDLARRLRPEAGEPPSDMVRLNTASYELWYFRDDCHIGAWEDAGYEGPVFDALSYLWPGRPDMSITKMPGLTSVDALAKALEQKQDRADVERALDLLSARGDIERDGDSVRLSEKGMAGREAIEDETDRRFFGIWHLDDAAAKQLESDLREVITALEAQA